MAGVVAEVSPAVAVPSGSGVCCSTKCSLHTEKGGVSPLCLSERPVLSTSSTGRGFAVEDRPLLASACPTYVRVSIHPPACMLAANPGRIALPSGHPQPMVAWKSSNHITRRRHAACFGPGMPCRYNSSPVLITGSESTSCRMLVIVRDSAALDICYSHLMQSSGSIGTER